MKKNVLLRRFINFHSVFSIAGARRARNRLKSVPQSPATAAFFCNTINYGAVDSSAVETRPPLRNERRRTTGGFFFFFVVVIFRLETFFSSSSPGPGHPAERARIPS